MLKRTLFTLGIAIGLYGFAHGADPVILRTPDSAILVTEPTAKYDFAPQAAREHRLGLGVNYTGGQLRWRFNRRWSVEGRYQQGSASSDYGTVTAHVFGLRGYRFFRGTSVS